MNVERLKENDSPKIINKLSKSNDPVLAEKAKLIVNKWTKMITGVDKDEVKEHNHKDHKKKRKKDSNDSSNSDSKESLDSKKVKLNVKLETNSMDSFDSNVSFDSVMKEENKLAITRTPRPSTAKVKPGKSRLDALVSSTLKPTKSRKESKESLNQSINNKKVSNNVKSATIASNKPLNTSQSELQISNSLVTSSSSLPSIAKTKSPVDVKPSLTQSTTVNTAPTQASVKHVLQVRTFLIF